LRDGHGVDIRLKQNSNSICDWQDETRSLGKIDYFPQRSDMPSKVFMSSKTTEAIVIWWLMTGARGSEKGDGEWQFSGAWLYPGKILKELSA
jgi:hypothetical protein